MVTDVLLVVAAVAAHASCSLLPTEAHTSRDGGDGWLVRAARPEQRRGGVVSVRLWWRPPELAAAGSASASAFLVTWEVAGGGLRGNLVTQARCATLSLQPSTVFRVQVSVLHGATVSTSHPLVVDTGRALQLHLRLHHQAEAAGGGGSWLGAVQVAPPAAHSPTPATLAAGAAAALLAALGVVFLSFRCLSSSCRRLKVADPSSTHTVDERTGLCAYPVTAPQGMPLQATSTVPENGARHASPPQGMPAVTGMAIPESDREGSPTQTVPATARSSRDSQSASGVSWLPVVELNMSRDWLNAV